MNILTFLSVLKARFLIVIWSVAVVGTIATIVGIALPENYQAYAKVQVDSNQKNVLTGLVETKQRVSEFLGQQSAIISSRAVALEVVNELVASGHLAVAEYEADWYAKTGGDLLPGNDLYQWIADQLLEKLEIESNALESALTVKYNSHDPSLSARYANSFADSYMRIVLENRKRRASRNAASFTEETRTLERLVNEARAELTQFQTESGIVTIGTQQLESAEVELSSLTSRLAEARGDNAEAQSLYEQVKVTPRGQLVSIPIPPTNSLGRIAQSRLGAIEMQLQRISEKYGNSHPDFIAAVKEREAQQRVIYSTVKERAEYTGRRVERLSVEVVTKKKQVVQLQKIRQRFNTLENNLKTTEETYKQIALRTQEESLQSRIASVEVLLLARAIPPSHPSTPTLLVVIIAGIVMGGGVGVSVAVFIELMEGRLRSSEGLAQAARAPVFAEIKIVKPRKSRSRPRIRPVTKVPLKGTSKPPSNEQIIREADRNNVSSSRLKKRGYG